jgi:hypothetical protein
MISKASLVKASLVKAWLVVEDATRKPFALVAKRKSVPFFGEGL